MRDIITPKAGFYNRRTYTKSKFLQPPNLHQKQVSLNHLHYRIGRILLEYLLDIDTRVDVIERFITGTTRARLHLSVSFQHTATVHISWAVNHSNQLRIATIKERGGSSVGNVTGSSVRSLSVMRQTDAVRP